MIRIAERILTLVVLLSMAHETGAFARGGAPSGNRPEDHADAHRSVAVYDVTALLDRKSEILKLVAGKEVRFSAPVTTRMKVVFMDLKPWSSWGHDLIYQRIDATSGQVLESVTARFPPAQMGPDTLLALD